MAVMELHRQNQINTTSMFTLDANQTGTIAYIIDKNRRLGFSTSGYNSTTTASLRVSLSAYPILSHIMLINHNFKEFNVAINTSTNYLINTATNSATSTYLAFSSVTVATIFINVVSTITPSQEKEIGELVATERQYQFERNPAIDDFRYTIARKQIRHEMPDGGTVLYNIRDKYKTEMELNFISQSSYDTLFNIYEDAFPLYFVPFPTTTGWNGHAFPVVWSGDFDFRYATNVKTPGYSGSIRLEEEPAG